MARGAGELRCTRGSAKEGRGSATWRSSHALVEIACCPIAEPGLKEAPLAGLALAEKLRSAGKPLDLQITATETGLDIDIRGRGEPSERERQALIAVANEHGLARLSIHGDRLIERRAPMLSMGSVQVSPPPGAFLQATRAGEEALARLVHDGCAGAKRVADLFAGCGPFALRLAETREVHAVDADAGSLGALDKAARGAPGLRRIATETRDLFRRPLLAPELERFDAVVLDPPRAGAEAQAKQLAASSATAVVSVSCDVGTFVRDAATLVGAGYRLERVAPVDQFKYSPHLEVVGIFHRDRPRRKRR